MVAEFGFVMANEMSEMVNVVFLFSLTKWNISRLSPTLSLSVCDCAV